MNYVILAAGQGSRINSVAPKPLVEVGGKTLLQRMLEIIDDDAHTVVVANAAIPEIARSVPPSVKVREVSTPSAAHSLYAGVYGLEAPVIAITVDAYFSPEDFMAFKEAFEQSDADALMGVTRFVDDESPLYVATNYGRIKAFADFPREDAKYVSAGVYGLNAMALAVIPEAIAKGVNGLREIQRSLLLKDLTVRAFDMGKVIDVDRPEDLQTAREL